MSESHHRWWSRCAAGTLAVALAGCSGASRDGEDPVLARISEARLAQTEHELTALGPRGAGTPGEVTARDYIARSLARDSRIEVSEAPFDYVLWQAGPLAMELDGPEGGVVPGGALAFSASTPPAGVTASMAYVGTGTQAEYATRSRRELAGRIHLVDTSEDANRALQYLNAQVFGAVGFVEMTSRKGTNGEALVELGAVQPFATIPALALDQDTGARLRRNLDHRLTIRSTNSTAPARSANLVGVLRGRTDDFVTVSAHLDSLPTTVGAVDDGSGVAGVLEIAHVLATGYDLERSVHFVFFSAEEQNLQGSFQYVLGQHASDIRAHCKLMVEIDVAGVAGGAASVAAEPRELGEQALAYLDSISFTRATGSPASLADELDPGSDVLWYVALGVPSLYMTKSPFIEYHTPYDTPDRMDFHSLRYEVAMNTASIVRAAGAVPRAP